MNTEVNPLSALEEAYRAGSINKQAYILRMYESHQQLFAYQQFIANKNIDKITITAEHVLVTTRSGITMICNPGDRRITPIEILNFGDYEASETRLMQSFLEPDAIVIDIGANTGWYCLSLARALPRGRVIAFEPIPQTISYLKANLALNGVTNVQIYEHGLSDEEREMSFFFHPSLSGATSARNLLEGEENVEILANVRRMDDVLMGEARVDLIKLDVEGAELFALRGAEQVIRRTKPILFIEMLRKWTARYDYSPNDIIAFMKGLGYCCLAVEEDKLRELERMSDTEAATNFFFLHREAHRSRCESLLNSI